ncbi:hypothetical protein [Foetidibacter luteolus]|uniref:hypothetical protein n=1 Tax=Foetidibacter luteolus TaxID=2608880 RepID=UPI00129A6D15|nr:hypothetical protein [Foetidibacter luteolus]
MPLKHKIYYALAALHLVMVMLFAGHFAEWNKMNTKVFSAISNVGKYTGSNNIFSFFAPGVYDQPYVVYTVKDTLGTEKIIDITGRCADFTNRLNNIYGYLTLPEARSVLSASLAQTVLNIQPSASQIRVAMVVQKIPSIQDYNNGKRVQWQYWFHNDFQKGNH